MIFFILDQQSLNTSSLARRVSHDVLGSSRKHVFFTQETSIECVHRLNHVHILLRYIKDICAEIGSFMSIQQNNYNQMSDD